MCPGVGALAIEGHRARRHRQAPERRDPLCGLDAQRLEQPCATGPDDAGAAHVADDTQHVSVLVDARDLREFGQGRAEGNTRAARERTARVARVDHVEHCVARAGGAAFVPR